MKSVVIDSYISYIWPISSFNEGTIYPARFSSHTQSFLGKGSPKFHFDEAQHLEALNQIRQLKQTLQFEPPISIYWKLYGSVWTRIRPQFPFGWQRSSFVRRFGLQRRWIGAASQHGEKRVPMTWRIKQVVGLNGIAILQKKVARSFGPTTTKLKNMKHVILNKE